MIKEKLLLLEYSIVNTVPLDSKKMDAIKQLKLALQQIDFKSEIIPLSDANRLIKLFQSLSNRNLNELEISIIKTLTNAQI